MDVHGPAPVIGEVALGLDPELVADPARGRVRAVGEVAAPHAGADLEQAARRERGDDDVRAARRIEAPARLHVPRVAPAVGSGAAVGVEELYGAQSGVARRSGVPETLRARLDRGEDPERLGGARVAAAVEPAHVERRARVQLRDRLPAATAADERPRPVPPQPVEGVGTTKAGARGRLAEGQRGVEAAVREGVVLGSGRGHGRGHDRSGSALPGGQGPFDG